MSQVEFTVMSLSDMMLWYPGMTENPDRKVTVGDSEKFALK